MDQNTLSAELGKAGIPVKRGVKVSTRPGEGLSQAGSNIWLYRWAMNSYRNFPIVSRAKGVRLLADSAAGLPAILVGVGPSLDDALPALKRAQCKALILSSDASLRALLAHGITPDLVLSYDCKPEQSMLWQNIPPHTIPALFDSCAHPDAIASWKGPVLFYNHYHQADELSKMILPHVFPTIGQIPSGGTVGNSLLFLSKILGCDLAIAVGMDFCYAAGDPYKGEGQWRYRATDYEYKRRTDMQGHEIDGDWARTEIKALYDNDERVKRSFVKTLNGQDYRMDPELQFYCENFVAFVKHFKINAVNTSPAGALAGSVPTMELEDILRDRPLRPSVPLYRILQEGWDDPRTSA